LDSARVIVTRVVADDVDVGGNGIKPFELHKQRDGRVGIDAVVEAHDRLKALEINGAVDIDALPSRWWKALRAPRRA
jgi:hypothetical protein